MGLKQCVICSEMVDEAKAFCPGCGNALVEEEGREASQFEKMDNTVQLGQTMYNQMLSDMGLNVAKGSPPQEKRIEIIEPAAATVPKKVPVEPPNPGWSNKTKWIILGVVIILMALMALVVAAAVLFYFFGPRIS